MVKLRHFREEDAEILRSGQYPRLDAAAVRGLIDEWQSLSFEGRYFEMFAVEADGRVVGSGSLYGHSPSVVSAGLEIFASERGKGFGSAALRLLIGAAAEKGYRIMKDQVGTDNAGSIRLHERCGFESDGYAYINRKGREVVLFLKPL